MKANANRIRESSNTIDRCLEQIVMGNDIPNAIAKARYYCGLINQTVDHEQRA